MIQIRFLSSVTITIVNVDIVYTMPLDAKLVMMA